MKSIKSWLVGTGIASVNLVTVINQVFNPARCSGNCGTCSFSCIPTILGVVGLGVFVVLYRKIKYKFNSLKNWLHQLRNQGSRFETHKPIIQSQNGANQYLWSVQSLNSRERGKCNEPSKD